MNKILITTKSWHDKFCHYADYLQHPFLLFVRLYWGVQLMQSGWGKLHNLDKVTDFFTSLGLPAPGFTATAISSLELCGGLLLAVGLFSRLISFVLTINMLMPTSRRTRKRSIPFFLIPTNSLRQRRTCF
jgi:hypothetical protein